MSVSRVLVVCADAADLDREVVSWCARSPDAKWLPGLRRLMPGDGSVVQFVVPMGLRSAAVLEWSEVVVSRYASEELLPMEWALVDGLRSRVGVR